MSEERRLRLTREVRKRLFDHQAPRIAGEGKCPVKQGQVIAISSKVSLKVLRVNVRRGGGWSLQYELTDRRDPVLKMKRTPRPQDFDAIRRERDEFGYPAAPTTDALEQAALDSAYTSGSTSIDDHAEAIHPRTMDEVNKRRREHRALWQREKQQLLGSLARLTADPETRLTAASEIRALQRQLEALDRKLSTAA